MYLPHLVVSFNYSGQFVNKLSVLCLRYNCQLSIDIGSPVHGDCCQGENAGSHCHIGDKVVDGAVGIAKQPVIVPHVNEVEETVEHCQQEVCHA